MAGETLFVGGFYIEKEYAEMIKNEIKESMLTEQRRQARQIARERQIREQERREEREYFMRQKTYGFIMILVSVLITALDGNLVCLVFALFGIYMMLTKEHVILEGRRCYEEID